MSSILHTKKEIEENKKLSILQKFFKYSYSLIISPIRPLLIAEVYEENKAKIKYLVQFKKHRELVLKLFQESRKLSKNYAQFIRLDLGLEVVFQLSGQIIYLLLSSTNTPTSGGLEMMFQKTSNAFLVLSIGLSVKTIYFVTLKTNSIEKPFLPMTSKLVLLSWIVVSASSRIMAIVFLFTPSFGLFSILGHWKLEQTPYSEVLNDRFTHKWCRGKV